MAVKVIQPGYPSRAATLATATKSNLSFEATIHSSVARSSEATRYLACSTRVQPGVGETARNESGGSSRTWWCAGHSLESVDDRFLAGPRADELIEGLGLRAQERGDQKREHAADEQRLAT